MSASDPVLPAIEPLDERAVAEARARWATRAVPPGALGRIEGVAVHLAGLAGRCPPPIPERPAVAVFAADHGVVASGASAWPQEITGAMAVAIADGTAAINAFARGMDTPVTVVDVGIANPYDQRTPIRTMAVRPGTGDLSVGPAMTVDEARTTMLIGRTMAAELIDEGHDCLIGGEMGIGNTTAAAALIGHLTGHGAESVTGAGAGVPPAGLDHKRRLVQAALERTAGLEEPWSVAAEIGGLEIAALAGFYLEAGHRRVPFIVDGVIALAALCVADRLGPGVAELAIAGHRSVEPAAGPALDHLALEPLLDLDLGVGEGTGACLAYPLVVAAARSLTEIADLPAPQTR